MTTHKHCKACDQTLPLMDFYGATTGRISSRCKECTKRDVKANRLVNLDKYKEYERSRAMLPNRVAARARYQQTESGKDAANRAKRRFIERNPEKRSAHIQVGNAIRSGALVRQSCEVCGSEKSHAHHDDYSKPLDVRWLCAKHHAERHKQLREQEAA